MNDETTAWKRASHTQQLGPPRRVTLAEVRELRALASRGLSLPESGVMPYRSMLLALGLCVPISCAFGDAYEAPSGYYAASVGLTGTALDSALNSIVRGHTVRTYDQLRQDLAVTDRDWNFQPPVGSPLATTNILLMYSVGWSGYSRSAVWDSGATWNREHTWPDSRGVGNQTTALTSRISTISGPQTPPPIPPAATTISTPAAHSARLPRRPKHGEHRPHGSHQTPTKAGWLVRSATWRLAMTAPRPIRPT